MNLTVQPKPSRRILHTADLHIGFQNDKACHGLEAVVNLAIKSRADLLLIAGDLFDHNRIEDELLEFVREQFRRLPIPVVVLPGNHDCLVAGGALTRRDFWRDCPNLLVFRKISGETLDLPYLNMSIWGRPIDTYTGDVHPMKDTPPLKKNGSWNIAAAHGYFVDTETPLFPSYHITQEEITKSGWDYVALGHVPVFKQVCNDPVACYCGSPLVGGTAAIVELNEKTGVRATAAPL